MTTNKKRAIIQPSEELAAIDEQLNAAMEHLDVTNTKVTEILGAVDVTPAVDGAESTEEGVDAKKSPSLSPNPRVVEKGVEVAEGR